MTTRMMSSGLLCNPIPKAKETVLDEDWHTRPFIRPPDPNARLMTEAEALERARGRDTDAPATALLVSYHDLAATNPSLAASVVHPDRLVWVVTVHADVTPIRARTSRQFNVYSLVIDAETGGVPDAGYGAEAVRDRQLVVEPAQRGHDLSHDPAAGPLPPHRR
jgi:hypothetical protein